MKQTLKRKIEDRAVGALKDIIRLHPTMDEDIHKGDKDLSWDGYIRIFKEGPTDSEKKNYDADIPIQVKGHEDSKKQHFGKDRVNMPVDIDDLEVDFRGNGCLYFQIFVSEDGVDSEIYYNSLFPSKIRFYLDFAKRKRNKKSYTIPFVRLKADTLELEMLCRQFATEMIHQGPGRGQIVSRTINVNDLKFVKNFSFNAVGARTPHEALQMVASGDVVVHGSYENGGIEYPVGMGDKFTVTMGQPIDGVVSIGDRKYYDRFRMESFAAAPGEVGYSRSSVDSIRLSPNLIFEFAEKKVTFRFDLCSDLIQLANDACFLLDMLKTGGFTIDGHKMSFYGTDISEEFRTRLESLQEVGQVLQYIGCKILIPFKELTSDEKAQIDLLVEIKKGIKTFKTDKSIFVYDWKFGGKIFPFIIEKDAEEIKFIGLMYNRDLKMSYGSPEENPGEIPATLPEDAYIVPNFVNLSPEQLGNLYYYDYESMFDQIDDSVINDDTEPALDHLTLSLIGAYDISDNGKLLEVAKALLERLIEKYPDVLNLKINMLQIEKRLNGRLSETQIEELRVMDLMADAEMESAEAEDFQKVLHFCIAVLLEDKNEAVTVYENLNENERASVDGYPIMILYERLK